MRNYLPLTFLERLSYAAAVHRLWLKHCGRFVTSSKYREQYLKDRVANASCFEAKYVEFLHLPLWKQWSVYAARALFMKPMNLLRYSKRVKRNVFQIREDESHDLSRYVVHTDEVFGGSSFAALSEGRVEKMVETQPGSGEFVKKMVKTLIFQGELKPIKPWTVQQQRQLDSGLLGGNIIPAPRVPLFKPEEGTASIGGQSPDTKQLAAPASPSNFTSPSSIARSSALIQSRFQFPGVAQRPRDAPEALHTKEIGEAVKKTGVAPPPAGHFHGFCAFYCPDYSWPDLDLTEFSHLKVTMRTDGRQYMFNMRAAPYYDLLYQARVDAEKPRPMHIKEIRFRDLIETHEGFMRKYSDSRLSTAKFKTFGFSISGPEGPFRLELECIDAFKGMAEFEKSGMNSAFNEEAQHDSREENVFAWLTDQERSLFRTDNLEEDVDDINQVRMRYMTWLKKQESEKNKYVSGSANANAAAADQGEAAGEKSDANKQP